MTFRIQVKSKGARKNPRRFSFHGGILSSVLLLALAAAGFGIYVSTHHGYTAVVPPLFALYTSIPVYPSDPNLPTIAVGRFHRNWMGFYNQQMSFSAVMMRIMDTMAVSTDNDTTTPVVQVLLHSVVFRDFLGTGKLVEFDKLFDVAHWNSFVPRLPRLVSFDKVQHYQYSTKRRAMVERPTPAAHHNQTHNQTYDTHPRFFHCGNPFRDYTWYMQSFQNKNRTKLHPVDRLILEGALRPAPVVQAAIDRIVTGGSRHSRGGSDDTNNYMAIHLRIEQDYLCHTWQFPPQFRNLSQLLERMEQVFPDPPADRCFLAFNRPLLENGDEMPNNPQPSREACEAERAENLATLNRVVRAGLWGGRVRVLERPSLLHWAPFRDRPVAYASWMDAEICRNAKIFIGRLGSTFALATIRRRSVMGLTENYNYEQGLQKVFGEMYPEVVEEMDKNKASNVERQNRP